MNAQTIGAASTLNDRSRPGLALAPFAVAALLIGGGAVGVTRNNGTQVLDKVDNADAVAARPPPIDPVEPTSVSTTEATFGPTQTPGSDSATGTIALDLIDTVEGAEVLPTALPEWTEVLSTTLDVRALNLDGDGIAGLGFGADFDEVVAEVSRRLGQEPRDNYTLGDDQDSFFESRGDQIATWGPSNAANLEVVANPAGNVERWTVAGDITIDVPVFRVAGLPAPSLLDDSFGPFTIFQDFSDDWPYFSWTCAIDANMCAVHHDGDASQIKVITSSTRERELHRISGEAVVLGDGPVNVRLWPSVETPVIRQVEPGHDMVLLGDPITDDDGRQWMFVTDQTVNGPDIPPAGFVAIELLEVRG